MGSGLQTHVLKRAPHFYFSFVDWHSWVIFLIFSWSLFKTREVILSSSPAFGSVSVAGVKEIWA